jgi:hypothetical protein
MLNYKFSIQLRIQYFSYKGAFVLLGTTSTNFTKFIRSEYWGSQVDAAQHD